MVSLLNQDRSVLYSFTMVAMVVKANVSTVSDFFLACLKEVCGKKLGFGKTSKG